MNFFASFPPSVPALTCGKGRLSDEYFSLEGVGLGLADWRMKIGVAMQQKEFLKEAILCFFQNTK
jgi:hypothetical protein